MSSVRANGFRPIGVDSLYSAFPSVCRFESGQLRLVWRRGSDHVNGRNGNIYTSTSADNGRTWSTAASAVDDPTLDLRDPCISTAGGTTWLTYFKGSASLAAAGCFVRTSTNDGASWSAETRIENLPYAAMCAPVIQVGANLLTAFYGKESGATRDSCWLATSTDGGATWTRQLVADGPAAGRDYQEPWLIARAAEVWMFFRYGNQQSIGVSVSTDSGATWSAPTELFGDTTGRPAAVWLSNGTKAVVARRISDKQAVIRTHDAGAPLTSWLPAKPTMVQPSSGPIDMQYAHPLEVPGGVICALGIESATNNSRIHVGWLSEGGFSPLGDFIPDDRTAAVQETDHILFAEGFSQANGPLRSPWTVGAGTMEVNNGYAVSPTSTNTPDLAWIDLAATDVELEADFYSSDLNPGYGLMSRVGSSGTYLLLTVESNGGFLRLYRFVNGNSDPAVAAAVDVNAGTWTRLRMVVRGPVIQCFINGVTALGHKLTAAEQAAYAGQTRHGIKLNPQGGNVHRCRWFRAKS